MTRAVLDVSKPASTCKGEGVWCQLRDATAVRPAVLELTAQQGVSSMHVEWFDMTLRSGEARVETFTSTTESLSIESLVDDVDHGRGFSCADPFRPGVGACRTAIATISPESVTGSLECTASGASFRISLSFRCSLTKEP